LNVEGDGARRRAPLQAARAILPWALAACIVAYLLSRVDVREVAARLSRVNAPAYLSVVFGFVALALALDALAGVRLFRAVGAAPTFWPFLAVRGASYLLGLVNYHVGQAHLTVLLTRLYRLPLVRVAGGTLMTYVTILGALWLLALPAAFVSHDPIVRKTVLSVSLVAILYAVLVALAPAWLRRRPPFSVLLDVGVLGQIRLVLWRLPHVACLLVETWIAYAFFGVKIPPAAAGTDLVFVLLVSGLPLTPMGLGTRDLAAVSLFSRYASDATDAERRASVLAAGGALVTATMLCQLLIGLLFARRGLRILNAGASRMDRS
jgi:hypothetical protein